MGTYYVPGEWNVICDRCGFMRKSHELREEWTGHMVCRQCWEPRHPQTLIQVPDDDPSVPWSRPEPTDTFIQGEALYTESGELIFTQSGLTILTET